jgi:hypothetical protein
MARKSVRANSSTATSVAVTTATSSDPVPEHSPSHVIPTHEEIAQLAYLHWQARGCPEGAPEQDWLQAEKELTNHNSGG